MRNIKAKLIHYSKLAHRKGLTGSFGGNMSIRVGNYVFIKGTGSVMEELTESQIAVVKLDGKVVSSVRPSSEYRLHLGVYRNRPEVRAVVHLHPPYSIVLSIFEREAPMITPEAELYLKKVPVLPFRPAGSVELAQQVSEAMKGYDAVVLERHGVVTVGRSLREAFYKAELVEEVARLWYQKFIASREKN
ncbi:fuculose phosphate aldolase [Pyrococcus furiosus DSM 3638]|uniref:Fuculose-1-phosphate aldolase n=3 Tax=Pyrococcus furiosus TaxID=2261 RepID=Q8U4H9_PYRFU|nr:MULTISPECIES: aldolase [Pyrococcus]AAL80232.1 fuculose-1-phosphate aldolase [Pyrococcus furiosus DSM 3638]AFN04469.1 L-fuculose phosphate aldolase [Pyrococcus furiosus COM1]MDK2869752.1 L-fuculose-phosphate aldolase [Pyrococcus sp.]QEK77838.1 fuculose phosphate aldolase [Pyrococcus furiosus DSM 3638]